MKIKLIVAAVAVAMATTACSKQAADEQISPVTVSAQAASATTQLTQSVLDKIGHTLEIRYRVVTNVPDENCDKEVGNGRCFLAEIDLTSAIDINNKD